MQFTPPILLLLIALPFCIWAAISDLRHLKIYNMTTVGLFLVFILVGLFIFPMDQYALRIAQAVLMLVVGFMLTTMGYMGAGDSKFIAAIAPFVAFQDAGTFLILLAAITLVTLALHRGVGAIKPLQPYLIDWKSFQDNHQFPYGLPLAITLTIYLAFAYQKSP